MKISSNFVLLIATAGLVGAGLIQGRNGSTRPEPTPDGKTITVPFRMLPSNHMVVEAKLNGKGPYRFIFDLGAPVTLLTSKAAQESGVIEKGKASPFFLAARGGETVETLQMDELVADDVPVIVMDHPALKALGGIFSKPLSGIIGYTFWARYRMTIDYQAKKMTFTPVEFEVKDLFTELPNRLSGPKIAKTVMLAPRGVWGLTLSEHPDHNPAAAQMPGVVVKDVLEGSPAAEAGLKPGDIITTLDGRWTTSVHDAFAAAEKVEPGRTAEVVVKRGDEEMKLTVTPREGL